MSGVTLQDLRADLERARHRLAVVLNCDPAQKLNSVPDQGAIECEINELVAVFRQILANNPHHHFGPRGLAAAKEMLARADVLEIATGYGLKAAMAYKLSDGAIDPRTP